MLVLLAEATTTTATTPAESLGAIFPSILAIIGALVSFWQSKKAWNLRTMLHAAAVGFKAAAAALPPEKAEEIKAAIKEAVGPLNAAMKEEVKAATAPRPLDLGGLPKLGLLVFFAVLLGGCVCSAVRDSAAVAQQSASTLRRASIANPAYDDEGKAAYNLLWEKHEAALRAISEAVK